jgi:glycosyltransferase involved in cell wall biosynthesis
LTGSSEPGKASLSNDVGTMTQRARRTLGRIRHANVDSLVEQAQTWLRSRDERRLLQQARAGRDVCWVEGDDPTPLVTVRITTYGRPDLLVERALPSVLAQTYPNIEVLVVGDCTDDATAVAIERIADARIRYVNLPYRPPYPARDRDRHKVLGYQALNISLDLVRGAWIAPCDDDDEFTATHVERLLGHAKATRAELVHSNTAVILGNGMVGEIGRPTPMEGHISHGAIMYSSALRFFRYNANAWRLRRPLDWDLVLRMIRAGVRVSHLDEVTYRYHASPTSAVGWRDEAQRQEGLRGDEQPG